MVTKFVKFACYSFILWMVAISMQGCKTQQPNVAYFRNVPDSLTKTVLTKAAPFKNPLIQSNDVLQVSVITLDRDVNDILAAGTRMANPSGNNFSSSNPAISGLLVDEQGTIELPAIGKVKVAGLTTFAARDTIHNRMEKYYKKPVVNVRFANFTVSVLGEVNKPGPFTAPTEKLSIVDAITMAGDLTVDAKRENVLLMRDSSNIKVFARFNLTSSNLLASRYFYLHQGDVVYVEAKKTKPSGNDAVKSRNLTIVTTAISVLATIITLILTRN
ncbi:polysaccharide biosynthesis/export family protein [Mucilaginibacter sp. HMF5004]|uniref:polysaccharide biosynthesis/export family protein n=1 Tax=Mucilaginibacter rivuli TaxID=2857527 RepID=UPI001C5EC860|nr:polysaccharide biosynthesis/export family protein [Mucilaginibacter rivuli]MBW4890154.1 polysaccharide biosynthesis/export family protein [Mucilaginibacter rivuli]